MGDITKRQNELTEKIQILHQIEINMDETDIETIKLLDNQVSEFYMKCDPCITRLITSKWRQLRRNELLVFGYISQCQLEFDAAFIPGDVMHVICEFAVLEEC